MATITTVHKFVTVAPGIQLYSERRTLSTTTIPKQTILFVHGLGSSINGFFPIFSSILKGCPESTLLAYDWAGNGLSPYPAIARPAPTFRDFVSDLENFIEIEAPEGPLTIISHSAGTPLTIRLLTSSSTNLLHASRVSSVIFIGGPLPLPVPPPVLEAQRQGMEAILQNGVHSVEERMIAMVLGSTTVREKPLAVALTRSIMLSNSKEAYAASIQAIIGARDEGPYLWERLPKGAKVLFLGGKEDQLIAPAQLEAFAGEVEGSKLVILDTGHSPTIEAPEEAAKAILEFLND